MATFGKLERVNVRTGWPHEDANFTPWLSEAENLANLGKEIGIDLEFVASEFGIGQYSLDILARKAGTNESVVIENQFGATDHKHLGQLLTYAAGVGSEGAGARTIIWIAEKFNEPHRAALDWLNKTTEPGLLFFGVEVELWKIGDSPLAPKFNIVSKPNEWQKQITHDTSQLSDTDRLYLEFWDAFFALCDEKGTTMEFKRTPRKTWWLPTESGTRGFGINLNAMMRARRMVCQVWIEFGQAKEAFAKLLEQREFLEKSLGYPLEFDEKPGKRPCEIFVEAPADVSDRSEWPRIQEWLKAHGEAFKTVFAPIVRDLVLSEATEEDVQ